MRNYNIQNYIRYINDVEKSIKRIGEKPWHEYTRDELTDKHLLAEHR